MISASLVAAALGVLCTAGVRAASASGSGGEICTPSFHRASLFVAGTGGFNDVAALSADDVWAVGGVGRALDGSDRRALIAHWDGRTWATVASPSPAAGSELTAVAGTGAGDAWAVGRSWAAHFESIRPLVLHWNGRAWRQVHVPGLGAAAFADVAAIAPNDVWAIGRSVLRSVSGHWDGSRWTVVPLPGDDTLHAILPWRNRVLAVGVRDYLGSNTPLIEEWTGTRWRVVFETERHGTLWSAVTVQGSIWGVGGFPIFRWDERWRVSVAPRVIPSAPVARTSDVTLGFGGIWVIVDRVRSTGPTSTLAHWTGHGWARARAIAGSILAIDARPEGVWAAGISGVGRRGNLATGTPLIGVYTCP